jgi:hypothetical protein
MSFETLKQNRTASMSKLLAAADKLKTSTSYEVDDRFWSPTVDKAGNGYAVIRFLPAKGEDVSWIRYWDHGFKGSTGRWYIENSLTSIGQQDPVSELNTKLWNTSTDDNSPERKQARNQKRRLHYVSNILVIADPGNPANEGKTFLFKFGKKIWDKIDDLMHPQFPGEQPINPFDFWGGANFKLKIRNVEGYRNYDKSEFEAASQLFEGNDDKLKALYEKLQPLQPFLDPKNFKSYADLKKKLIEVLGSDSVNGPITAEDVPAPTPYRSEPTPDVGATDEGALTESDDDETPSGKDISYFAKLAQS